MTRLAALCLLVALGAMPARAGLSGAEKIALLVDGEARGTIGGWRKGDELFLSLKSLGDVYGGQQKWAPVSGKLTWRLAGRTLVFRMNAKDAELDGRDLTLPGPVLPRVDDAYAPVGFLNSPDFAQFTDKDTEYREQGETLEVHTRATVGTPRVFSYNDRTRVEAELAGDLAPEARRVGPTRYEVVVPGGVALRIQPQTVDDGLVRSISVKTTTKLTVLTLELERPDPAWGVELAEDPHRLVIDIQRPALPQPPPAEFEPSMTITTGPVHPNIPSDVILRAKITPPPPKDLEPPPVPSTAAVRAAPEAAKAVAATIEAPSPVPVAATAAKLAAVPSTTLPRGAGEGQGGGAIATQVPPPPTLPAGRKRPLIVIDAGHGGKDSGAVGSGGVKEKDVNLKVALELAALMRREGRFDVLMTRDKDVFVPLRDRSMLANRKNADLFISLHCNSLPRKKKMHGFEIYFMSEKASDPFAAQVAEMENAVMRLEDPPPPESPAAAILRDMAKVEFMNESSALSGLMAKELKRRLPVRDHGVKQAAFFVLRGTETPAVLVEMGYLTSPEDRAKLTSPSFRKELAEGLYASILKYAKLKNWAY